MMSQRLAQDERSRSYSKDEDSQELDQGTPNDVRMFPVKKGASSQSIPIANNTVSRLSELQRGEEEALAEYRDYCMYQRIIGGMGAKSLDASPAGARKEQLLPYNQATQTDSIENMIRMRKARSIPESHSSHSGLATHRDFQQQALQPNGLYAVFQEDLGLPNVVSTPGHDAAAADYETEAEEGIFELEL